MKKQFFKYVMFTMGLLLITSFIFMNSFNDSYVSHNLSDAVVEIILPPKYALADGISLLIRKTAHLIEYAALGVAVITLAKQVEKDFGKKYYSMTLFYVLAVAVIDEHIQSFSDRTSSTSDILLDFAGAVIGMLAVLGTMWIVKRIRRIKKGE